MSDGPLFGPYICSYVVYVSGRASALFEELMGQYLAPSAVKVIVLRGGCCAGEIPIRGLGLRFCVA